MYFEVRTGMEPEHDGFNVGNTQHRCAGKNLGDFYPAFAAPMSDMEIYHQPKKQLLRPILLVHENRKRGR